MAIQRYEVRAAHANAVRTRRAAAAADIVAALRNRATPKRTIFDEAREVRLMQERVASGVYTPESCARSAEKHGTPPPISKAEETAWELIDTASAALREAMRTVSSRPRFLALKEKRDALEALREATEWTQPDGSGGHSESYYRVVIAAAKELRRRRVDGKEDPNRAALIQFLDDYVAGRIA